MLSSLAAESDLALREIAIAVTILNLQQLLPEHLVGVLLDLRPALRQRTDDRAHTLSAVLFVVVGGLRLLSHFRASAAATVNQASRANSRDRFRLRS